MKRTSTQHDLMLCMLEAAGGQAIENLVPTSYVGLIADILFAEDDVIVDRPTSVAIRRRAGKR